MSLDFANRFAPAGTSAASSSTGTRRDLPKAKAWLNIGYTVPVRVQDGEEVREETRFVSLPVGIPLDTMDEIQITSRNTEFAQFQAARNGLLSELKAAAEALQPGEERIINLQIQLRHVNDAVTAPAADETNPFVAKLDLIAS